MRRTFAYLRTGFSGLNNNRINELTARHVSSVCWNCQKPGKNMICGDCGSLQDVDNNTNYFELLNFPTKFELQASELTQRFRQLQARVHPDKYSNKTTREQTNSADWSSLINKAYKTLAAPVERGQYMLQLEGEQMPQDNSALNTAFLMAMMERNEEVEEADDSKALDQLYAQIVQELADKANKLTAQFETNDLAAVKQTLVEMKYLLSIQNSIKKKQQQLMSNVA
ncbi:iron-sulfur cluster co-chaperone protein HscB isoform X2 [Drosophila mojavensis]|uniref:iron-sulfur cluster co-chaperone protein HscB isoform X2 n=1 Tax=Drosophila mojavensis TaxID=7230 RepID=UPI001CD1765D|nr:iron-sulfur cluster co-chaperone protein HscB isoform X2 [Drosophila mojavensis]